MMRPVPARGRVGHFPRVVLPAVLLLIFGVFGAFAYLTYRLTHPPAVQEPVNPSNFLLHSVDVVWTTREGAQVEGWWIPGRRGAPGVLLAPGYGMSRSDGLSLAAALNQEGFNILTYDAPGSGAVPRGVSSLGLRETDDMLAALNFLRSRPGVDFTSLGIWGVDVSARAALAAAASVPAVRALVVDSAYDSVADFLNARIHEDFGWDNSFLKFGCREMFRLYMRASSASLNERLTVARLGNRSILFIQADDRKELAHMTAELCGRIQPRKELVSIPNSRTRLLSSERLNGYDRQVTGFFHLNLQ